VDKTGNKTAQYSFKGPKSERKSPQNACVANIQNDFGGGLVQMPEQLKPSEQAMGSGFTVYHFVDSIDEVSV
jgi:hypothetical protein